MGRPVVIVTRPEAQGARFLADLRAAAGDGWEGLLSPALGIETVAARLPEEEPEGLVVTSAHGAAALTRLPLPRGMTVWCVGARTAEAVRQAGLAAISADGDADALVSLILQRGVAGPLLHLRGERTRGAIAERLTAAGVRCGEAVVYRQVDLPLTPAARAALAGGGPVVLPVFSPETGSVLARQGPFPAPLHVVAISPAAAEAARDLAPSRLTVAPEPSGPAMLAATVAAIRQAAALEGGDPEG